MYTHINFRTKKQLKEAVAAGKQITVYQHNDMGFAPIPTQGKICIEGPHFPEPHKWYAEAELKDGFVVKVK